MCDGLFSSLTKRTKEKQDPDLLEVFLRLWSFISLAKMFYMTKECAETICIINSFKIWTY